MFQITLENIQAIKKAVFDIEENTIVEFTGDNSNGKSILSKVIQALTSGDIKHKDVRMTLINDDSDAGSVIFIHNQEMLGCVLKPETRDSFVVYDKDMNDISTRIVRYMSEGGIDELVQAFGFRTYAGGDICLQLSPTWGAIPFVTTSGAVNNDIVQDITVDKIADEFLRSFHDITFPIFKDRIGKLRNQVESYNTILSNMTDYDWEAYGRVADKMKSIWESIQYYQYFTLDDIPVPPINKIVSLPYYQIDYIPLIHVGPIMEPLDSMSKEMKHLVDVLQGVCPTCGRPLVDCERNH